MVMTLAPVFLVILASLVHSHIAVKPPAVKDVNPEVPQIISDIIFKLMSKAPADRYQTARGLLRDLKKARESSESFALGLSDLSPVLRIPPVLYGREKELVYLLETSDGTVMMVVVIIL